MEFNPPPLANVAANQHLDNAANFCCETLYEKAGRATVRYEAALKMMETHGNAYITEAELGQQATFLVQQALLAGAGVVPTTTGAAADDAVVVGHDDDDKDDDIAAPEWAASVQDNPILSIMKKNHAQLQVNMNNLQANIQASTNNLQTNVHASVNNLNARFENGLVTKVADCLVVITNHAGVPPPNFPRDYSALMMLSDERIADLLTFYGLEVASTAMARQTQLCLHLGIRTTL